MLTIIIWFCAAIFSGIGIYAGRAKTPMHFWSDSTVSPEKCKDIVAYNKANQKLWLIYSVPFWLAGFIGFFSVEMAALVLTLSCTLGLIWPIWQYGKISKKYLIK